MAGVAQIRDVSAGRSSTRTASTPALKVEGLGDGLLLSQISFEAFPGEITALSGKLTVSDDSSDEGLIGGGMFCAHCGTALAAAPASTKKFCATCGTLLGGGKFCPDCGAAA